MQKFVVPTHPLTEDIPDVDEASVLVQCYDFIENVFEIKNRTEFVVEAKIRYLMVVSFHETIAGESSEKIWIVCGNVPFLLLDSLELTTPIECLAIYSLYLYPWLNKKGISEYEGDIPIYRIPPEWESLSFSPGYEDWRMGGITSYISWRILEDNQKFLINEDIRSMCSRRGWIPEG